MPLYFIICEKIKINIHLKNVLFTTMLFILRVRCQNKLQTTTLRFLLVY